MKKEIDNQNRNQKRDFDSLNASITALRKEIYWVHQKLDRLLNQDGLTTAPKKKSFLKKIDSFFYQNLFKHFLRLFNIPAPPPEKKKNFFKRLDSFLYQVLFKHILNLFKK
jgi:hypothetical protein